MNPSVNRYQVGVILFLFGFLIGTNETKAGSPETPPIRRGFYLGVESGVADLNLSGTYTNYYASFSQINKREANIDREYSKVFSGINLGYGRYMGRKYLALETDLSFYQKKIADRFYTGGFEGDLSTGFGFDISNKLKANITGIAGFRVGAKNWVLGQLGLTHTDIYVAAGPMPFHTDISGAVLNWKGITLGLGYTRSLSDQWKLRIRYNYTTYVYGPRYSGINMIEEDTDYKLRDNRVSLGLIYELNFRDYPKEKVN